MVKVTKNTKNKRWVIAFEPEVVETYIDWTYNMHIAKTYINKSNAHMFPRQLNIPEMSKKCKCKSSSAGNIITYINHHTCFKNILFAR